VATLTIDPFILTPLPNGKETLMRILAIGEILFDIMPHSEHLGGAPLNFAAALQRLGNDVFVLSGIGNDDHGKQVRQAFESLGLNMDYLQGIAGKATGAAIVSKDSQGNANFFIQRPAAFDGITLDRNTLDSIQRLQPDWIYYGTLAQYEAPSLTLLETLFENLPNARRFYDMNLREGHWSLPLVRHLSDNASILKLNEDEAQTLFQLTRPNQNYSLKTFCEFWSEDHAIETICVTQGGAGCSVYHARQLDHFEGFPVQVVDTVGAGDAFAAGFLHGHLHGWSEEKKASFANSLGALVASRMGAIPEWSLEECAQIASSSREQHS